MRRSMFTPACVRARAPALPAELDALDLLEPDQALGQRGRPCRHRDQVDVLDAVRPAPGRAGDLHLRLRASERSQAAGELLADLQRSRQQQARLRALAGAFGKRREHPLLELRAKAAHRAHALLQGGFAQLLQRVHAELRMQQARALGSQARQPRHRHEPRRELRAQPLGRRNRPRLHQREDLLLQRRADARQLARTPLAGQRRDRDGSVADAFRGRAVGQHAVDYRPVELVQVAELFHRFGDRRVGRLRRGHDRQPRRSRVRAPGRCAGSACPPARRVALPASAPRRLARRSRRRLARARRLGAIRARRSRVPASCPASRG